MHFHINFDYINAALMRIRDFFLKKKIHTDPKLLKNSFFLFFHSHFQSLSFHFHSFFSLVNKSYKIDLKNDSSRLSFRFKHAAEIFFRSFSFCSINSKKYTQSRIFTNLIQTTSICGLKSDQNQIFCEL